MNPFLNFKEINMSDEQVVVTCALSGQQVPRESAIEFKINETEEVKYVSAEAVLNLVHGETSPLKRVIMEQFAYNDGLFMAVSSLREKAIARNQGAQTGAAEAVKRIQEAAEAQGVDVSAVLKEAFPAPEVQEVQEDSDVAEG